MHYIFCQADESQWELQEEKQVLLWPLSCKALLASAVRHHNKVTGTSGAVSGCIGSAGPDLELPFTSFGTRCR